MGEVYNEATADLRCECGRELHVTGSAVYVSQEATRFQTLHKREDDGHGVSAMLPSQETAGRDNDTRWWEAS